MWKIPFLLCRLPHAKVKSLFACESPHSRQDSVRLGENASFWEEVALGKFGGLEG